MSLADRIFGSLGYERRITGGVVTKTFENSEVFDVGFGSRAYNNTPTPDKIQKFNKILWQVYCRNPLIWGAVETVVRMVCGNDVKPVALNLESENGQLKANAEKLQKVLDRFWNSQANNMTATVQEICRELIMFGEVIPIYDVSSDGTVEVGFISPNQIKTLNRGSGNIRKIDSITITSADGVTDKIFKIISRKIDKDTLGRYPNVRAQEVVGKITGDVSYFSINRSLSQERGVGDFTQAIDPAEQILRLVNSIVNRTQMNNLVVSCLEFPPDWTQERINKLLDPKEPGHIKIPTAADTKATTFAASGVKFSFVTPNIPASENAQVIEVVKGLLNSGTNIPQHWLFGQGENANKASASEMSDSVYGYLRNRQSVMIGCLKEMCDFVIDQNRIYLSSELRNVPPEELTAYAYEMPRLDVEDDLTNVNVMSGLMNVIAAAKMNGGIDDNQVKSYTQQVMAKEFK